MIKRNLYISEIIKYLDTKLIKILTGIRRSGKSTLLLLLQNELIENHAVSKDQIINFRFDSMEYDELTAKEMYQIIKNKLSNNKHIYLFLDEVQEIDGWEKVVNSINTDYDVDLYITGSNSRMMSSEIATYLTGRYVTFHIFTLSFAEYLEFRQSHTELLDIKNEFVNYIKIGGFPATQLQNFTSDEVYTIVKDIYNSTIYSDIVKRNNIKKIDQLERIVKFVFDNIGSTFSATTISKYLKSQNRSIDNETVYSYLEKLEKAYLIHRCSRYDLKGKEILKTQEKFYLADTSFKYSVLGYSPDTIASSIENIVYIELCRRGYKVFVGKMDTNEIDFVAEKNGDKIYIQVTQEMSSSQTAKREYSKLLEIKDNYPKYVLTLDDFADGNYNGIITAKITDFLLDKV